MEIVNFGHFKLTSTTGIQFFANEDGQDWYDLRRGLTTWDEQGNFLTAIYGAWAMVDPVTLRVTNVEQDPSRMVPNDKIVLGIDADAGDIAEGLLYQSGVLVAAPPEPTVFQRATGKGDGRTIPVQDAIGITMKAVQDLDNKLEATIEAIGLGGVEPTRKTLVPSVKRKTAEEKRA